MKFHVFLLTITTTGRIDARKLAEFLEPDDALAYAKQKAFRSHRNVMVVHPDGSASIHSEHA
jgi:hypothetical protein